VDYVRACPGRKASVEYAFICVAVAFFAQFLTVHYNYGGNWTALFCTGSNKVVPSQLASERIYTFANRAGYDGQFYHYIAHDPFFERGLSAHIDMPRTRYRRILVPGFAYLLAAGEDRYIDTAYLAVMLGFVFLGAYWLGRYFVLSHHHPAWSLSFGLVPAVVISLDRLTVDLALAALCVGFAYYTQRARGWQLYLVLVAASLVRETGLLLPAACTLSCLWQRQWRNAILAVTAVLPAFAWYFFVSQNTPAVTSNYISPVPLSGYVARLLHPTAYAEGPAIYWIATVLDYLALLSVPVAFALAFYLFKRRPFGPVETAMVLFALLGIFVGGSEGVWTEVYSFGRSLGPLPLLAALHGVSSGSWELALPMLATLPRIGFPIGSQLVGILRGLLG
jgi:hypothetical protein